LKQQRVTSQHETDKEAYGWRKTRRYRKGGFRFRMAKKSFGKPPRGHGIAPRAVKGSKGRTYYAKLARPMGGCIG